MDILNLDVTVQEIMGLIFERKKMTKKGDLIIKIRERNKIRNIILMGVVILVVHTKGRSGEMIKGEGKYANRSGVTKFDRVCHMVFNNG